MTQTYRFHWRDGKQQDGEGRSPADALSRLGYGNGALAALDYWETIPPAASPLGDAREGTTHG